MQKISYEEYVKNTNMFFVDEALEEQFEKEIQLATDTLCERMKGINSEAGIEEYIRNDENAIDNLISIMNISSEKFKRVVTSLRLEKGHNITSEWNLGKIRTVMLERADFMREICHLLLNGANDPKFQKMIPKYYLENFVIDSTTMARLARINIRK